LKEKLRKEIERRELRIFIGDGEKEKMEDEKGNNNKNNNNNNK
jgi:hypothetical protein